MLESLAIVVVAHTRFFGGGGGPGGDVGCGVGGGVGGKICLINMLALEPLLLYIVTSVPALTVLVLQNFWQWEACHRM